MSVPVFRSFRKDPLTAPLNTVFNQTLWNDLDNSGIFEMVAKSFYPLLLPGSPVEMKLDSWGNPPPNAAMVAFGNLAVNNGRVAVQGWLFDTKNSASPQVLGKQYNEEANADNARLIAHRFADEIIYRLGGGVPGVVRTQLYYINTPRRSPETWSPGFDSA